MASVQTDPKGGKKKSLDPELNLVPFIDLLSMCICFLLMTAVWIEIGSLQIKQGTGTEAEKNQAAYDMEVSFPRQPGAKNGAEIILKKAGRVFKKSLLKSDSFSSLVEQMDTVVKSWGGLVGLQSIASATITPNAAVSYEGLVSVLDLLRKHQIVNLGVVPGGSQP